MAFARGDSENNKDLAFEEEQIFGENNAVEEEEGGGDSVDLAMDLHANMIWLLEQTLVKLDHDYALAGFALSVNPMV